MKCIYSTWLNDFVIDGLKYVKIKEGCTNDDDVIRLFLKDYAAYNQDIELGDLLRRCDE